MAHVYSYQLIYTLPVNLSQTSAVRGIIDTRFKSDVYAMTALSDGTVAIYGRNINQQKLMRFSLATGRELSSTELYNASGISEVKLEGNSVIAVSFP